MSVPLSTLQALMYSRTSSVSPRNAIRARLPNGTCRSQIRTDLTVCGTAWMPWVAITFSGCVQMQQNLQFGKRRRRRETIARSVASFPKFMLPKLPKKLMLAGLSAAGTPADETTRHP